MPIHVLARTLLRLVIGFPQSLTLSLVVFITSSIRSCHFSRKDKASYQMRVNCPQNIKSTSGMGSFQSTTHPSPVNHFLFLLLARCPSRMNHVGNRRKDPSLLVVEAAREEFRAAPKLSLFGKMLTRSGRERKFVCREGDLLCRANSFNDAGVAYSGLHYSRWGVPI